MTEHNWNSATTRTHDVTVNRDLPSISGQSDSRLSLRQKRSLVKDDATPFRRHPGNPILTAKDLPYVANSVFNAGATRVGDEIVLLMRVEDRRGISHLSVARSANGVSDWRIDENPAIIPEPDSYPEGVWGLEDPRITYLEEKKLWVITYTAWSEFGPLIYMSTTTDFQHFERQGPISVPEDKDAALFPTRFDGRWAMIHRPVAKKNGTGAHIWISFSPDLKHWGSPKLIIRSRKGAWWDTDKIGLGPPPLKTSGGWLILYHGVKTTGSGVIYRLGLALLHLDDPTRVTVRSDEWVFSPEEEYEIIGDVDKVVFPCGWVSDGDEVSMYYGAGDAYIALATASVSELLAWLKEHNVYS